MRFPKHKELFADDYYENAEKEEESNPFNPSFPGGKDTESFTEPTHRSTNTGILSSYKK